MKTFLQICQDVRQEAGLSGSGPVSVATAIGIEKRIVGWVVQAWIDIQQYRPDWPWMIKEFSFQTSPGKKKYPVVELGLSDVERWDFDGAGIYKTSEGIGSETEISSTTYSEWWKNLRIGNYPDTAPSLIFADPVDNSIVLHPAPDGEYTITTRYHRALQRLSVDGDIPGLPTNEALGEIIKWKALLYYAYHDGAPDLATEADAFFTSMIQEMDNRYGTVISFNTGTLA